MGNYKKQNVDDINFDNIFSEALSNTRADRVFVRDLLKKFANEAKNVSNMSVLGASVSKLMDCLSNTNRQMIELVKIKAEQGTIYGGDEGDGIYEQLESSEEPTSSKENSTE